MPSRFFAAAGYELLQKGSFALDASFQTGGYGLDRGSMRNVSVHLGLSFY